MLTRLRVSRPARTGLCCALVHCVTLAAAQGVATPRLYVYTAEDTPLEAVDVYFRAGGALQVGHTDDFGSVALHGIDGEGDIYVRRVGYRPDTLVWDGGLPGGDTVFLRATNHLREVEVRAARDRRTSERVEMSLATIESRPAVFGVTDVLRSIQRIPGINFAVEGSGDYVVRGGGIGENGVLLDGVPFSTNQYLFGFVSNVNPRLVQRVSVFKGGFPARYSDRLSSVVDVHTVDSRVRETDVTYGMLYSGITLSRPVGKASTLHVGARASPLGFLTRAFGWISSGGDVVVAPDFADLHLKWAHQLSPRDRLGFTAVAGWDRFLRRDRFSERGITTTDEEVNAQGNAVAIASYAHERARSRLTFAVAWGKSRNSYLDRSEEVGDGGVATDLGGGEYTTEATRGFARLEHVASPADWLTLTSGATAAVNGYRYVLADTEAEVADEVLRLHFRGGTLYHQADATLGRLALGVGLNASYPLANAPAESISWQLAPRLSASYTSPWGRLSASATRMVQTEHLLANQSLGQYLRIWLPADRARRPAAQSDQVGVAYDYDRGGRTFGIGAYAKRRSDLVWPREGSNLLLTPSSLTEFAAGGRGDAYGIEAYYGQHVRSVGRLDVSYAYARSELTFNGELNRGRPFPDLRDRPHVLRMAIRRELSAEWVLDGSFLLQSGTPYTAVTSRFPIAGSPRERRAAIGRLPQGVGFSYRELNDQRLPPYHRLDLSLTRARVKGGRRRTLTVGVYNAYARANPLFVRLEQRFGAVETDRGLAGTTESVYYTGVAYFTILPFVSYRISYE